MSVAKNNSAASGLAFAAERMLHLVGDVMRRLAMQFAFAAEIQAQAAQINEARQHLDAQPAVPAEAPTAPRMRVGAPADAPPAPPPKKPRPTTEIWRSEGTEQAQPTEVLSKAPEAIEWNEVAWGDFADLASEMAMDDLLGQLFQLAYELAKHLLDGVSEGGRQTPQGPIERNMTRALADAMADVIGSANPADDALQRLEALDRQDPLYMEKAYQVCGDLFMDSIYRLPDSVPPEAIQPFCECVMRLACNRFHALAPDGALAAERSVRVAREKAYKQYILQDFRERMRQLICPDAEALQDAEAAPPSFTFEEEQLALAMRRLCDEIMNVAVSRVRGACKGLLAHFGEIDGRISAAATNWSLMRLDHADRGLLRAGTYELVYAERKMPFALVINETVELAKLFGKQESPAFVNGVLDRIRVNANAEPVTYGAAE